MSHCTHFLAASTILAAFAAPAMASDYFSAPVDPLAPSLAASSVPAVAAPAPAPAAPAAPSADWTGGYFGRQMGYGEGTVSI